MFNLKGLLRMNLSRLRKLFQEENWDFSIDEKRKRFCFFSQGHFFYAMEGFNQATSLFIRGRWRNTVPLTKRNELSQYINEINHKYLLVKGYAVEESGQRLVVIVDFTLPLGALISDEQLKMSVIDAINSSEVWFDELEKRIEMSDV